MRGLLLCGKAARLQRKSSLTNQAMSDEPSPSVAWPSTPSQFSPSSAAPPEGRSSVSRLPTYKTSSLPMTFSWLLSK